MNPCRTLLAFLSILIPAVSFAQYPVYRDTSLARQGIHTVVSRWENYELCNMPSCSETTIEPKPVMTDVYIRCFDDSGKCIHMTRYEYRERDTFLIIEEHFTFDAQGKLAYRTQHQSHFRRTVRGGDYPDLIERYTVDEEERHSPGLEVKKTVYKYPDKTNIYIDSMVTDAKDKHTVLYRQSNGTWSQVYEWQQDSLGRPLYMRYDQSYPGVIEIEETRYTYSTGGVTSVEKHYSGDPKSQEPNSIITRHTDTGHTYTATFRDIRNGGAYPTIDTSFYDTAGNVVRNTWYAEDTSFISREEREYVGGKISRIRLYSNGSCDDTRYTTRTDSTGTIVECRKLTYKTNASPAVRSQKGKLVAVKRYDKNGNELEARSLENGKLRYRSTYSYSTKGCK